MPTIYLVSCVSQKASGPAPARDLYTSDLFCKSRAYVERTGAPWFILSAKYGLLRPDQVITKYDKTLNTMPIAERRRWAEQVLEDLSKIVGAGDTVVVLAGAKYQEFLTPALRRAGVAVCDPLEGKRFGPRLRWLKEQLDAR